MSHEVQTKTLEKAAAVLLSHPTEENWAKIRDALRSAGARYYKLYYVSDKLGSPQDLLSSFVEIYGENKDLLVKLPIYELVGQKPRGALVHLAGLRNLDLVA
ncbi:MAG: hypothetical protein QW767_04215 [Thermoprotei archaeon]